MLFESLAAKRHVLEREQRTALDYAQAIRSLCDEVHPDEVHPDEVHPHAEKIILMQDNLNTKAKLQHQVSLWQNRRNQNASCVQWHFTTKDARIKPHKLYPNLLPG